MTVCLPLFRVNNYNLAVQGWDLDEGVEHGPAEVGGRDDLNRCNNALNQMVVDLDSSVLDRDPAAAAVLRAPTSNDAGLNKPGLVVFFYYWGEPVPYLELFGRNQTKTTLYFCTDQKKVTFLHEPKS